MSRTCRTCRYWTKGSVHYECRRNPPAQLNSSGIVGSWPATNGDDWCGEHKPHKEPDQKALDKMLSKIPAGSWPGAGAWNTK